MYEAMLEIVERRCEGRDMTAEERERFEAARRVARPQASPGAVAVIPVHGILAHRMDLFTETSGGTSYESLAEQLSAAVSAPGVATILLDINSPGGEVYGLEEFASQIVEARKAKPVVAIANAQAASAAYWIASQADEFVVTPSGEVGSVGIISMHVDYSKYLENEGIKPTYLTTATHKAEFNPAEPLGEDSRAYALREMQTYHDKFVHAVASGRKVARKRVEEQFGKGRMVTSERAVELGMADRIESFDATVARMQKRAADAAKVRAIAEHMVAAEAAETERLSLLFEVTSELR
jgi:signal peptide peptidase SppA